MIKQITKDINEIPFERMIEIVDESWNILKNGGIIISQLDVSYGFMGVTPDAIKRINELKRRNRYKYASVFGTNSQALRLLLHQRRHTYLIEALEDAGYPVAYTGKINHQQELIKKVPKAMYQYLAPDDTLTVFANLGRISSYLPLTAETNGQLILGSSANITGMGNIYESSKLPRHFIESCDLIVGNGNSKYKKLRLKTTIISLLDDTIMRTGPFHQEIQEFVNAAVSKFG